MKSKNLISSYINVLGLAVLLALSACSQVGGLGPTNSRAIGPLGNADSYGLRKILYRLEPNYTCNKNGQAIASYVDELEVTANSIVSLGDACSTNSTTVTTPLFSANYDPEYYGLGPHIYVSGSAGTPVLGPQGNYAVAFCHTIDSNETRGVHLGIDFKPFKPTPVGHFYEGEGVEQPLPSYLLTQAIWFQRSYDRNAKLLTYYQPDVKVIIDLDRAHAPDANEYPAQLVLHLHDGDVSYHCNCRLAADHSGGLGDNHKPNSPTFFDPNQI